MSLIFAVLASLALGITGKKTKTEQFQYALYCFGSFLLAVFGIGWLMYLGHG